MEMDYYDLNSSKEERHFDSVQNKMHKNDIMTSPLDINSIQNKLHKNDLLIYQLRQQVHAAKKTAFCQLLGLRQKDIQLRKLNDQIELNHQFRNNYDRKVNNLCSKGVQTLDTMTDSAPTASPHPWDNNRRSDNPKLESRKSVSYLADMACTIGLKESRQMDDASSVVSAMTDKEKGLKEKEMIKEKEKEKEMIKEKEMKEKEMKEKEMKEKEKEMITNLYHQLKLKSASQENEKSELSAQLEMSMAEANRIESMLSDAQCEIKRLRNSRSLLECDYRHSQISFHQISKKLSDMEEDNARLRHVITETKQQLERTAMSLLDVQGRTLTCSEPQRRHNSLTLHQVQFEISQSVMESKSSSPIRRPAKNQESQKSINLGGIDDRPLKTSQLTVMQCESKYIPSEALPAIPPTPIVPKPVTQRRKITTAMTTSKNYESPIARRPPHRRKNLKTPSAVSPEKVLKRRRRILEDGSIDPLASSQESGDEIFQSAIGSAIQTSIDYGSTTELGDDQSAKGNTAGDVMSKKTRHGRPKLSMHSDIVPMTSLRISDGDNSTQLEPSRKKASKYSKSVDRKIIPKKQDLKVTAETSDNKTVSKTPRLLVNNDLSQSNISTGAATRALKKKRGISRTPTEQRAVDSLMIMNQELSAAMSIALSSQESSKLTDEGNDSRYEHRITRSRARMT